MNTKTKILLTTLGCVVGLAVAEQTGGINCYFSKYIAGLDRSMAQRLPDSDLASSVRVERPDTRWLPFIKFGKTVEVSTRRERGANGAIFETVETVHTDLLVIGLCSTAKYNELADGALKGRSKNEVHLGLASWP